MGALGFDRPMASHAPARGRKPGLAARSGERMAIGAPETGSGVSLVAERKRLLPDQDRKEHPHEMIHGSEKATKESPEGVLDLPPPPAAITTYCLPRTW